MRWVLVLIAFVQTLLSVLSIANAEDTALGELKNHLEQKAPRHWQVHVRWRDGVLLASFMPPYHEAFDLWYKPETLLQKMSDLCPERGGENMGHAQRGPGCSVGAHRRRKDDR